VNWKEVFNEGSIAVALVLTVVALVIIVIAAGADAVAVTGLRDLALLLGGALAGTKVPRQ
jgi:hypothetical protein